MTKLSRLEDLKFTKELSTVRGLITGRFFAANGHSSDRIPHLLCQLCLKFVSFDVSLSIFLSSIIPAFMHDATYLEALGPQDLHLY